MSIHLLPVGMSCEDWEDLRYKPPSSELFVRVNPEFIEKQLSNEDLQKNFPDLRLIINHILEKDEEPKNITPEFHRRSKDVFRYIHSQYLMTEEGQKQMYQKFIDKKLPQCPRVFCKHCCCFPVAINTETGRIAKMICPICREVYNLPPPFSHVQNGSSFAEHWIDSFFENYEDKLPKVVRPEPYEGRLFGFKIMHDPDFDETIDFVLK